MNPLRSPWLLAFGIVFVTHLGLLALDLPPWTTITKCLLAPLLLLWVLQQRGPGLIALALAFCFLGDLFLDLDEDWFLPGMMAFAAGHACFIAYFVRLGAINSLRGKLWLPAGLLLVAVGLLTWLWTGLPAELRLPVAVYALILATTAATSLAVSARAGIGGFLFLFSDAVIALGIAGRIEEGTARNLVVMSTYGLAIFFLASASVRLHEEKASGFDRTKATDCWPTDPGKIPS